MRAFPTLGRQTAILGLGVHVPERVLGNAELERMVDTSDEWIVERTGIRERHVAEPGTASFELAVKAGREALDAAGVEPEAIDLVMVASSSPDAPFPAMACRVQECLGLVNAWAFDLLAACTGLLYELAIADAMIASGRARTALVIGAEVLSRILDWGDRSTCVLLGDAAGALVVGPARHGAGIRSWCLGADGRQWDLLVYGDHAHKGAYAVRDPDPHFKMNGRETYMFAVDNFARQALAVTEAAGLTVGDVDLFVPHQANRRIIESAARRAGIAMDRVVINIDRYGNTSTATIPLALRDAAAEGRLHPGDRILLASFGAGLTWAACLLDWE
ncbi:MAG TPA: beta-ketoacyl-ACP synthase III [Candidatus Dormibacteraeota bacterium]|nr:beta-ketoacyl-ACP synthase III [Candidatus Dormibacteraeota bacterium]